MIHFDPWWNPAVEKQATDRAYRIGQTNPVFVYKLIMANSIEQKVFKMQQHKQALVDALFTDKSMSFTQFDEEQMLGADKKLNFFKVFFELIKFWGVYYYACC